MRDTLNKIKLRGDRIYYADKKLFYNPIFIKSLLQVQYKFPRPIYYVLQKCRHIYSEVFRDAIIDRIIVIVVTTIWPHHI